MAAPTPWEPGPPATSPTCSTNYSQHFNKKTSFVPMKGFISIIGLLLPCTTTSHKTSVEPSLAGITPQTLATLISRPIPLPDQDTLDFLHSVLHGADVALDRRVLVHQDIEPFAHDSDTPGLRSAVQNKASAHQLALPAIIRCPIALIARISNMVKCHSRLHTTAHGAVDEDWRLEKAGARPVLDRRRPEFAPRDYLQYPRARNSYDTKVVANAY